MSIIAQIVIILGIATFLAGYWFLGKNSGMEECQDKFKINSIFDDTYKGGTITVSIGMVLMLGGLIMSYID